MSARKTSYRYPLIGLALIRFALPSCLAGVTAAGLYFFLACVGGCGGYGEVIFAAGIGGTVAIVIAIVFLLSYLHQCKKHPEAVAHQARVEWLLVGSGFFVLWVVSMYL